jgi:hypothetical protein
MLANRIDKQLAVKRSFGKVTENRTILGGEEDLEELLVTGVGLGRRRWIWRGEVGSC